MSVDEGPEPDPSDAEAGPPHAEPVDAGPDDVTPPIETQSLSAWLGREVFAADGGSLGSLGEIYFDVDTDEPQFGVVHSGTLIHHRRFVPLVGVVVGPDSIQISATGEQVKSAPNADRAGNQLTPEDESALYHHYRLNYVASDRESGRRLVRH